MELEDRYPDEAAEAAWASQEQEPPTHEPDDGEYLPGGPAYPGPATTVRDDPLAYGLSIARAETSAVDDELTRLRMGILDAEHRLRLLADRTDDYGPEGMRTRLVAEYQKLAHLAWVGPPTPTGPEPCDDEFDEDEDGLTLEIRWHHGEPTSEWLTRNRVVALCKRYGHNWEGYGGAEMNGPYVECSRCGEMSADVGPATPEPTEETP